MRSALGCWVSTVFKSVAFSFLVDVRVYMDLEMWAVGIPVMLGAET